MSILNSYPKGNPKKGDYLIGTKIPLANTDEKPVTQNFSVGDVAAFANTYSLGYTVYTALISQTSTNAPTAKIIQDTIPASLTWSRTSAGTYAITASADTFTENKTIVFINYGGPNSDGLPPKWTRTSNTQIKIITQDETAVLDDGVLTDAAFEIRVYN